MSLEPTQTVLRLATRGEGEDVWALLWAARDDIPLSSNFELPEHRAWVTQQCVRRRVSMAVEGTTIAAVMVIKGTEIFYLVVRADVRRAGLARSLVARAKRWARRIGLDGLTARASPGNEPVISLLTSEGFSLDISATAGDGSDWHHFFWPSGR